ncbi:MAG TPA: hypothetical protein VHZ52_04680 [Acidobacteriaceae bacterium]|jgi:hypothetical protein|nr:hypothetical protein [Acidobacteriaceae bacterium]
MTKKKTVTTPRFDPKAIPMQDSEGHVLLPRTPEFTANLHRLSKHTTKSDDLDIKEKAVLWSLIHFAGTRGTFVLALTDREMQTYTALSRASLHRALTGLRDRRLLAHGGIEKEWGTRTLILLNPKTGKQFAGFVSRKQIEVFDHVIGNLDRDEDDFQAADEVTPWE